MFPDISDETYIEIQEAYHKAIIAIGGSPFSKPNILNLLCELRDLSSPIITSEAIIAIKNKISKVSRK